MFTDANTHKKTGTLVVSLAHAAPKHATATAQQHSRQELVTMES